MQKKTLIGHLGALFTVVVWGTTFISTKVLLQDFSPAEILMCRFSICYVALWAAFPRRLKTQGLRQDLAYAAAGLCGVTLYFLLENIALTHTLAANVGVIISISPFFTAILARYTAGGERQGFSFYLGFVAAITGIALISFGGNTALQANFRGDALAVLAALVWAVYSNLMRKIATFDHHTALATRRVFFYGILFILPALAFLDFHPALSQLLTPQNLLNFLYLGLCASALCFITWNWAVGVLGPVKTSVYIYMVPVVTVVASALILREPVTPYSALGTALTLAGLMLSEGKLSLRQRQLP